MISAGASTSTCWYPMMNSTIEDDDDHHHHVHGNSSPTAGPESSQSAAASLFFSFSILKEKVHQLQSLVSLLLSTDQTHQPPHEDSASIVIASMSNVIQELIVTASSMMFNCQQMSLGSFSTTPTNNTEDHHHHQGRLNKVSQHPSNNNVGGNAAFYGGETLKWFGDDQDYNPTTTAAIATTCHIKEKNNNGISFSHGVSNNVKESSTASGLQGFSSSSSKDNKYDIIELNAADLLAKYTHYCQVCSKGFKRDANLRMHMRAHGDEYKTSAALSNPMKNVNGIPLGNHDTDNNGKIINEDSNNSTKLLLPRKYSCPQEGCRWNKKHAKFQPLKSMICVKNHYKRSHCPKMYMCKRCNRKQFSVLSDLRTHEKHCGDLKWQCSCGTTFSRKDKLMGHVALFIGHSPMLVNNSAVTVTTTNKPGKISASTHHNQSSSSSQMQLDKSTS